MDKSHHTWKSRLNQYEKSLISITYHPFLWTTLTFLFFLFLMCNIYKLFDLYLKLIDKINIRKKYLINLRVSQS